MMNGGYSPFWETTIWKMDENWCIRIYMNLLTHGKSGKINDFKDIF